MTVIFLFAKMGMRPPHTPFTFDLWGVSGTKVTSPTPCSFPRNRSLVFNKERVAMEDRKADMVQRGAHGHLADRVLRSWDDCRYEHMMASREQPEHVLIKAKTANNTSRPPVAYSYPQLHVQGACLSLRSLSLFVFLISFDSVHLAGTAVFNTPRRKIFRPRVRRSLHWR